MHNPATNTEIRLEGLPISGGIALARVCLFNENRHSNLPVYRVSGEGVQRERDRYRRAVDLVVDELGALIQEVAKRVGPAESQIFKAQQAILQDKGLSREILHVIDTAQVNAESAVVRVFDVYESRLMEVDNEYIKERASDIGEIRRRLLDVLANMNPSLQCADAEHCQAGATRIVVAEELTASLTVDLDKYHTLGFVTERGGPNSHAAILARAMGIPAVTGIEGIHGRISCGTELLVDGDHGCVVVWPTPETIASAGLQPTATVRLVKCVEPVPGLQVLANISVAGEVDAALDQKAEGIGLYRTEFEFFAAERLLEEDEQAEVYRKVVHAMEGRRVCFRMLDIGGDKGAEFFGLPQEENPSLGFRGSRLLLGRRDLFTSQARAIARASIEGPVDVMYPMVVDLNQFFLLRQIFSEATAGLSTSAIRHGVMFEVPAACLRAEELLGAADFGSIGTNDLIQYLLAVDRNNSLVAGDYSADSGVLWDVLAAIAAAATKTGRDVSVCGELAANVEYVRRLQELGYTTLSVSSRFISKIRSAANGP